MKSSYSFNLQFHTYADSMCERQKKIDSLSDTNRVAKLVPKSLREEREKHPAAPAASETPDRPQIDPLINYYLQAAAPLDGEGEGEEKGKDGGENDRLWRWG